MSELKTRRTWPQRLMITLNIFLILVCLATAFSLNYFYTKVSRIGRVELGNWLTPSDDATLHGAEDILIVGIDSGEGLDPNDPSTHRGDQAW